MTEFRADTLDELIAASSEMTTPDDIDLRLQQTIERQHYFASEFKDTDELPWVWIFVFVSLWLMASLSTLNIPSPIQKIKRPASHGLMELQKDNRVVTNRFQIRL